MSTYEEMTRDELLTLKDALQKEYDEYCALDLSLNMARGKPAKDQLDLSMPMLDIISSTTECVDEAGTDLRNYGILDGIEEAKVLMASMLDDDPANVIVFGNSSLNIMYDTVMRCWVFGTLGATPWSQLEEVKFLCPVPGYDRHFGVTEAFGIKMIPVPMNEDGPDMDVVKELVANDASVKGIWCVPKYSNPGGVTYSDEVVRKLASMPTAADDFRIFWDNAYGIHHIYEKVELMNILEACERHHHPDRAYYFFSTSKITFPGAGLALIASNSSNVAEIRQHMSAQIISYDKINQLRHVQYFQTPENILSHMDRLAQELRPKFDLVLSKLKSQLGGTGLATWSTPKGGYFISLYTPSGCAKRTVALAKEAGVTLTDAGATYPYGKDESDRNIRIAPSYPTLEELDAAMDIFILCIKIAALENK